MVDAKPGGSKNVICPKTWKAKTETVLRTFLALPAFSTVLGIPLFFQDDYGFFLAILAIAPLTIIFFSAPLILATFLGLMVSPPRQRPWWGILFAALSGLLYVSNSSISEASRFTFAVLAVVHSVAVTVMLTKLSRERRRSLLGYRDSAESAWIGCTALLSLWIGALIIAFADAMPFWFQLTTLIALPIAAMLMIGTFSNSKTYSVLHKWYLRGPAVIVATIVLWSIGTNTPEATQIGWISVGVFGYLLAVYKLMTWLQFGMPLFPFFATDVPRPIPPPILTEATR